MTDKIILTYGSSPTSKKFSNVLHVKGIDGPDNVVLVNPVATRSDDGTEYEYAEGYKRRILVNLGVVQSRADQLWLWNFFWAQNTKKISYCGENSPNRATVDHTADEYEIVGHTFANGDRVIVESTGTLPSGLSETVIYYVVNVSTDFLQLSLTNGGAAVSISSNGTGFFTITKVAETELAVTIEDFAEFVMNWSDNIKTAKEVVLPLIEKNARTTNPSSWS